MNIITQDKEGRFIITEESPINWMSGSPEVTNECPFCSAKSWLRIGPDKKACTECGAQWKLKLGDIL